jgi:DNA-binding transcriptional LysR family regulator
MADLSELLVLARVVERGSFSRAAKDFAVPPSTLSRKVAALERRLGVRLLERTTRSLRVTEVGAMLAARCARIARDVDDAERAVADHSRAPRGVLRISTPQALGDFALAPILVDYLRRYPEMRVEVIVDERVADLVRDGLDAAIRVAPKLADSSLVAVRLGRITPVLIAAPAYLERAPPLKHPRDIVGHHVVGFGRDRRQLTWSYVGRGNRREQVQVTPRALGNSFSMVRTLCEGGIGLAQLPAFVTMTSPPGALVALEPGGFRPVSLEVAIVMPSARQASPKTAAFVDLMRGFVAHHPELFEPM